MKLLCFDILTEIIRIQFTGNHHLLKPKGKLSLMLLKCIVKYRVLYLAELIFLCCTCDGNNKKKLYEDMPLVFAGFIKALCMCVRKRTFNPSDRSYGSTSTTIFQSLHCFFFILYQIASYFFLLPRGTH